MSKDDDIHDVQRLYPQIYVACHTDHVRAVSTEWRISSQDASILVHLDREFGLSVLQRLDAELPDVIVADLGMPGMDGLALIEAVRRRLDAARTVPAIALTAYARSQDRLTALSSGYQRHLPKPIDHSQLVATIRAITTSSPIRGDELR